MKKHGKKYRSKKELVEEGKRYTLDDAFKKVVELSYAKFDETVDVSLRLGVDPKHADQMVRAAVNLPHGIGRSVRVVVFARGEKIEEAKTAGADEVGGDDLIEKIKGGWMEFDAAIATPDMMVAVSKIGKVLGPRGLMPNPKLGTVTMDLAKAVKEVKAGKVEFRTDKAGIIHAPMGKVSFGPQKLRENFNAVVENIVRLKPSSAKGRYFRTLTVSTTMSPGVGVEISELDSYL